GLPGLVGDHRAPLGKEYREQYEALVTELGPFATVVLRDEAARVAALRVRAIVASVGWAEAVEKRRVGRGRRPSERRVERLARRAALDDGAAVQALDRL